LDVVDDSRGIREPAKRLRSNERRVRGVTLAREGRVPGENLDEPLAAGLVQRTPRRDRLPEAEEHGFIDQWLDAVLDDVRDEEMDGRRSEIDSGADAFGTRRHSAIDQDPDAGPAPRRRGARFVVRAVAGFAEVGFGFAVRVVFGLAAAVALGLAAEAAFGFAAVVALGLAAVVALGLAADLAEVVAFGAAAAAAAGRTLAAAIDGPVDFRGDALLRRRVPVARDDAAGRAWRFFSPSTRAPSSRTSAVTSASRTVRFSRFLSVARPSRSRRRVSSSRAAARANSSHSTWRTTAATGVIATASSFAI
jgi:hypothetical protein